MTEEGSKEGGSEEGSDLVMRDRGTKSGMAD